MIANNAKCLIDERYDFPTTVDRWNDILRVEL
jgi:hypothetical protein